MKIYLDNAATTPLDREAFSEMEPFFFEGFGNPSSAHGVGREARKAVEKARGTIAGLLNAQPSQILFTAGGTEADNTAICSAIESSGIKLAITTQFEHHAVLNTLKSLERDGVIKLLYLMHDAKGNISLKHLESILAFQERAFVSVMHGNNEIGNLNDIDTIAQICRKYNALFHSDTVQTMGHYVYDLSGINADFIVGSAHKFNGPKGVGFLYHGNRTNLASIIKGGGQENGWRAGTENVAGIVGMAKALEIAYRDLDADKNRILSLKARMIGRLKSEIPEISFNGNSADPQKSLYTVLSLSLPSSPEFSTALAFLDSQNIFASGGSACTSHSTGGSHVLHALNYNFERTVIRFSFGKYNTEQDIDYTVEKLVGLYHKSGPERLKVAG
ncbi:cysteine desulfurase [Arcticibacter tournemirensis]|uniref:Cysteine desulfurase n=1 Tax=Arcticibacter tournemirensis TaxID=699437 RepID=A0A5M9HAW1_9SPHI|nr:cysteine desulfurase family protein [Arcticibacter tournemirensis]KAA8484093.1 cysteine desulfurase [Arcticibacter tournemirensis]TQM51830.1 cysteine desulfurase [Arcticibacter tournemirensis]